MYTNSNDHRQISSIPNPYNAFLDLQHKKASYGNNYAFRWWVTVSFFGKPNEFGELFRVRDFFLKFETLILLGHFTNIFNHHSLIWMQCTYMEGECQVPPRNEVTGAAVCQEV